MIRKRFLYLSAAVLVATALSQPPGVSPQQNPPCAGAQAADRTIKQKHLDDCLCEQSTAQDNPSYRVGAAPFGRKAQRARLRVGKSARRGQQSKQADLYEGLEMPDLKDLKSPEVVGLRQKMVSVREEAWQRVETSWQHKYREAFRREIERRGYFNNLNQFFKAEPLQGNPEDYLKPEIHADLLAYLRKSGHQFAGLEREYQRLKQIHDLKDRGGTLPKFDWREQGLNVGAVMNQGDCNSCWAFATVSVYQSNWYLEQILTGQYWNQVLASDEPYGLLDRFASVQQVLNCIGKEKGDCTGGWHGTAFAFMVGSHVPHIADRVVERRITNPDLVNDPKGATHRIEAEGYTGKVTRCVDPFRQMKVNRGGKTIVLENAGSAAVQLQSGTDKKTTNFDRALAWGYVNEQKPDQLPTVAQLKQALIEHGPLAMPIQGDACFSVYQGGVFNGRKTGNPNHVMVLIGWDDEKQAWLIKNSWGEEWGEKGFCWVAYGSNSIGLYAAWIQPTPSSEKAGK